MRAWFYQLGTPRGEELAKLQSLPFTDKWGPPSVTSKIAPAPLPTSAQAVLGKNGLTLVRRLLSWTAERRGTAEDAEAASLFNPESLVHAQPSNGESYADPSTCSFTGVRHHWNCKIGEVAPEILGHMMEDVENRNLYLKAEIARNGKPPSYIRIAELGNATKFTIAGWLTKEAKNARLNDTPVTTRLPFIDVRKWRNALVMITNRALVEDFWLWLRARLNSLEGDLGPSGSSLINDHPNKWFLSVCEAHITERKTIDEALQNAAKRRKGAPPDNASEDPQKIEEDLHNDGSASGVHLGLTWAGKRRVRFLQEEVQPTCTREPTPTVKEDVILECYPGHVYVGGVTGARHQVIHDQFDDEEALLPFNLRGSKKSKASCSVTFMFRSCIFSDRSRSMNTTPNPRNVWNSFTACVRQLIHDPRFRLPTFQEYSEAPDE